jgi:hypothetical protein
LVVPAASADDRRLLLFAVVAVLAAGLLVAAGILLVTGRADTPEPVDPVPFGFAKSLRTKVAEGGPVAFAGTTGDTGFWLALEDGKLVALQIRKPGTEDCNVRWRGSVDSFVDCHGDKVRSRQLARFRTEIPTSGARKGNLLVDLRDTVPPPAS